MVTFEIKWVFYSPVSFHGQIIHIFFYIYWKLKQIDLHCYIQIFKKTIKKQQRPLWIMLKQNLMRPKRFDSMDPQGGARLDLTLFTVYSHFNIQPKAFAVVVCSLPISSFICFLRIQPPKAPTLSVQSGQKPNQKTSHQRSQAIPLCNLPSALLSKMFSTQLDLLSRLSIGGSLDIVI